MGNYCCSETEQASKQSSKFKKTVRGSQGEYLICDSLPKLSPSKSSLSEISSFSPLSPQNQRINQELQRLCQGNPISKGGQSQIFQITTQLKQTGLKRSDSSYVIKRISKQTNCLMESPSRQLLMGNHSPFLVKGLKWLNGDKFIFQLMEKQEGGDLSTFLEKTKGKGDAFRKLGEQGIKMILAGIILGLQYMHQNKVIYCDLKLQNILIGKDGYPLIIDFDLSRIGAYIDSDEVKGTLIYASPEIFTSPTVDRAIDLWALGILTYILLYGETPFEIEDVLDPQFPQQCKKKQSRFYLKRKKASPEIINLINGLLRTDPNKRLGYNSVSQLKNHKFFQGLNWNKYQQKELKNPLSQIVEDYSDKKSKVGCEAINVSKFIDKQDNRVTKCNFSAKSSFQSTGHPS